jgi:hypothetical protein
MPQVVRVWRSSGGSHSVFRGECAEMLSDWADRTKGLDYFEANMGLELQPDRVCAVLPKPEMISRRR